MKNIKHTNSFFEFLGFVINIEKSVLTPCHRVKFLGFCFDTLKFTIEVPISKRSALSKHCRKALSGMTQGIRSLSE